MHWTKTDSGTKICNFYVPLKKVEQDRTVCAKDMNALFKLIIGNGLEKSFYLD